MPKKSKRYISRAVLKTEMSVIAQCVAEQNYGRARELVLDVLERVEEYDLPGGEKKLGKLPTFEEVNEARLESTDVMLENVTKKQLRAAYDLIYRQLQERVVR